MLSPAQICIILATWIVAVVRGMAQVLANAVNTYYEDFNEATDAHILEDQRLVHQHLIRLKSFFFEIFFVPSLFIYKGLPLFPGWLLRSRNEEQPRHVAALAPSAAQLAGLKAPFVTMTKFLQKIIVKPIAMIKDALTSSITAIFVFLGVGFAALVVFTKYHLGFGRPISQSERLLWKLIEDLFKFSGGAMAQMHQQVAWIIDLTARNQEQETRLREHERCKKEQERQIKEQQKYIEEQAAINFDTMVSAHTQRKQQNKAGRRFRIHFEKEKKLQDPGAELDQASMQKESGDDRQGNNGLTTTDGGLQVGDSGSSPQELIDEKRLGDSNRMTTANDGLHEINKASSVQKQSNENLQADNILTTANDGHQMIDGGSSLPEQTHENHQEEIDRLTTSNEELRENNRESSVQEHSDDDRQVDSDGLTTANEELREIIRGLTSEKNDLQQTIEHLRADLTTSNKENIALNSRNSRLGRIIGGRRCFHKRLTRMYRTQVARSTDLADANGQLHSQVDGLDRTNAQQSTRIDQLETSLKDSRKRLTDQSDEFIDERKSSNKKRHELNDRIERLENERDHEQSQRLNAERERDSSRKDNNTIGKALSDTGDKLKAAEAGCDTLKRQLKEQENRKCSCSRTITEPAPQSRTREPTSSQPDPVTVVRESIFQATGTPEHPPNAQGNFPHHQTFRNAMSGNPANIDRVDEDMDLSDPDITEGNEVFGDRFPSHIEQTQTHSAREEDDIAMQETQPVTSLADTADESGDAMEEDKDQPDSATTDVHMEGAAQTSVPRFSAPHITNEPMVVAPAPAPAAPSLSMVDTNITSASTFSAPPVINEPMVVTPTPTAPSQNTLNTNTTPVSSPYSPFHPKPTSQSGAPTPSPLSSLPTSTCPWTGTSTPAFTVSQAIRKDSPMAIRMGLVSAPPSAASSTLTSTAGAPSTLTSLLRPASSRPVASVAQNSPSLVTVNAPSTSRQLHGPSQPPLPKTKETPAPILGSSVLATQAQMAQAKSQATPATTLPGLFAASSSQIAQGSPSPVTLTEPLQPMTSVKQRLMNKPVSRAQKVREQRLKAQKAKEESGSEESEEEEHGTSGAQATIDRMSANAIPVQSQPLAAPGSGSQTKPSQMIGPQQPPTSMSGPSTAQVGPRQYTSPQQTQPFFPHLLPPRGGATHESRAQHGATPSPVSSDTSAPQWQAGSPEVARAQVSPNKTAYVSQAGSSQGRTAQQSNAPSQGHVQLPQGVTQPQTPPSNTTQRSQAGASQLRRPPPGIPIVYGLPQPVTPQSTQSQASSSTTTTPHSRPTLELDYAGRLMRESAEGERLRAIQEAEWRAEKQEKLEKKRFPGRRQG